MPRHDIPDRASAAELAEIARQLRAKLPSIANPRAPADGHRAAPKPTGPKPMSRSNSIAMLRFVGAFTLPGLLLVALIFAVGGGG